MRLIKLFLTTISLIICNVSNSFGISHPNRNLQTINKTNSNVNPFILQTKNTKVEDFDLFFISYGLFGTFVVSSLIAKKIFNISDIN